jgi:hypothetical protein
MAAVVAEVTRDPGKSMLHYARRVAPVREGKVGVGYGYDAVHRTIRAGLVWPILCLHGGGRTHLYPLREG